MKQEWRLRGKKAKAGFGTPLLWLCLSFPWVLPSDLCLDWSLLRLGLHGCKAGEEPAGQGAARVTVAGAEGERVAHSDLAQVPDSPCAQRTILQ